MYRRWRDSQGKDNEYPNIIRWGIQLNNSLWTPQLTIDYVCVNSNVFLFRKQALAAKAEAEKEGIVVPLTLEDYCIKPKSKPSNQEPPVSLSLSFARLCSHRINQLTLIVFLISQLDMTDFYDEDYDLDTDDDDDDEQSNASDYADGDDSGNGET